MKKLFSILCLTFSASLLAQDPGIGDSALKFKTQLNETLKSTKEKMELQISARSLNFSDYTIASQNLLNQINQSQAEFVTSLKGIEDFLSLYDEVQKNQSNRAMERLLDKKKEELNAVRAEYSAIAKKFITLDNSISLILQDGMGDITWSGVDWYKVADMEVQMLFEKDTYRTSMDVRHSYKGYWGKRDELKENLMAKLNRAKSQIPSALFSDCKTQGCVYYLAEDYTLWLKEIQSTLATLKMPVKDVTSFKGPEYDVKIKTIRTYIDQYADKAAENLPTTL